MFLELFVNKFDRIFKKARKEKKNKFLIFWNRGLGDIPLGLYALVFRIRLFVPNAEITFLTRRDLKDGFKLLFGVKVVIANFLERGKDFSVYECLQRLNVNKGDFDIILDKLDLTKQLSWQVKRLTPKLLYLENWDNLINRFSLKEEKKYIAVHVNTETGKYYGYEKNLSKNFWIDVFKDFSCENFILFGLNKCSDFKFSNIIDLRGETTILEMLSIIKNRVKVLIAPDSGILSLIYYLNKNFSLNLISLWGDSRQGIFRQKVNSPNKKMEHTALIGKKNNIKNISSVELCKILKQRV